MWASVKKRFGYNNGDDGNDEHEMQSGQDDDDDDMRSGGQDDNDDDDDEDYEESSSPSPPAAKKRKRATGKEQRAEERAKREKEKADYESELREGRKDRLREEIDKKVRQIQMGPNGPSTKALKGLSRSIHELVQKATGRSIITNHAVKGPDGQRLCALGGGLIPPLAAATEEHFIPVDAWTACMERISSYLQKTHAHPKFAGRCVVENLGVISMFTIEASPNENLWKTTTWERMMKAAIEEMLSRLEDGVGEVDVNNPDVLDDIVRNVGRKMRSPNPIGKESAAAAKQRATVFSRQDALDAEADKEGGREGLRDGDGLLLVASRGSAKMLSDESMRKTYLYTGLRALQLVLSPENMRAEPAVGFFEEVEPLFQALNAQVSKSVLLAIR